MSAAGGFKRRIALVDDEVNYLTPIKEELERREFEVFIAPTEEKAREEILHGSSQFFVFDIFLRAYEKKVAEASASKLISLLDDQDLGRKPWVVLSGETGTQAFIDLQSLFPNQVRAKFEDPLDKLVDWLVKAFEERVPHNFSLAVSCEVGAKQIGLPGGGILAKGELRNAVEEALRILMGGKPFEQATVRLMPFQGYGRTLKFKVKPFLRTGTAGGYLLKAGNKPEIEKEYGGYQDLIRPHSFPRRANLDDRPVVVRRYSLAALLYELVEEARQLKELYDDCASLEDLERLTGVIEKVFKEIAWAWFKNAPVLEGQCLWSGTFGGAEKNAAEEDAGSLDAVLAGLSSAAGRHDGERLSLVIGEERIEVFNPDPFSNLFEDAEKPVGFLIKTPSHGDLHSGNILVLNESGLPVLIDFSEARRNQSLFRDFAKLEAHLALDLLPEPSALQPLRKLIEWQVDWKNLVPLAKSLTTEHFPTMKTVAIIARIRKCMVEIIDNYVASITIASSPGPQLLYAYYFALWREYVRAWTWMADSSPMKRLQNLMTISRIVEICFGSGPTENV